MRARVRLSALGVSIVVHAAAIAAGALLESGASATTSAPVVDARYEARVVERAVRADEIVAATPELVRRDAVPAARGGDVFEAADLALADDVAPPCAAPSISLDGGSSGRATPREWSPRPSLRRSAFFGTGHGGRRSGGDGTSGVSPEVVQAAAYIAPAFEAPAPPPPPPVRVAARMLAHEQPEFPESARDRGLEGVVRVEVDVLADGSVGAVRVVATSGVAAFDAAAVVSVRRWRFAPATIDGVGVSSTLALPAIRFRLE